MEYFDDEDQQQYYANFVMEVSTPEPEPQGTDAPTAVVSHPGVNFLDLPEHVRTRIYQYAGLFRKRCVVYLNFESARKKVSQRDTCALRDGNWDNTIFWGALHSRQCDHPEFPMGLLQASHALRLDVLPPFFSLNHFGIVISSGSDFRLFCNAVGSGMDHLRSLHIDLRAGDNRYLKLAGGVHQTIIKNWTNFCNLANLKMHRLKNFSLKCKVRDIEVAQKLMVEMDPFPVLTDCAFHFWYVQDEHIQPAIKRAALRLTDNLPPEDPWPSMAFPFLRLPKEVQLLVLEKLLTNKGDPYLSSSDWSRGIVSFQERRRMRQSYHETYQLTCCRTCSPIRSACFCHTRQTAYSTSCSCFQSPLPYFLVCREFYEDARRVFFSKNKFVFLEEDPEFMMRTMHYIPTSSFLMIRQLCFKFPMACRVAARPAHGYKLEDPALLSWSVLRRFIREHFDLGRLSLTIVDLGSRRAYPDATPNRNKYLRKLLKSFADLRGLQDFRVYLADDRVFEEEAERIVLGPSAIGRPKAAKLPFVKRKELPAFH